MKSLQKLASSIGFTEREEFERSVQARVLELGTALRDARLAKKWSQTELAEKCGVPQPEISRIENGSFQQGPTAVTLCRLAQALDVRFSMIPADAKSGKVAAGHSNDFADEVSPGSRGSAPAIKIEDILKAVRAGDRNAERRMSAELRPVLLGVLRFGTPHRSTDEERMVQETLRTVVRVVRIHSISEPQKVFEVAAKTVRDLASKTHSEH